MANEQEWVSLGKDRPIRWEEDGLTVTRTTARSGPGCHNGCMALLYTDKEGKLVKVEGDPEDPYNQGRLCSRCLALPEVVYHPDRLMYPMKRDRKNRGKDAWERISWDQAYEEIVEKFEAIKKEYGAESVVFAVGTGRDIFPYIARLAWSFGSPNAAYLLSGTACYMPRVVGMYNITGAFWVADCAQNFPDRYDNPEYSLTDVLAIWGNNPLESNADGFFGHWVIDLMKRGTRLMVVDPRTTWLASKAELHLPLRPGTDAALALAMINIIIEEDLYDKDFVDRWCYGFDELKERAAEYPVGRVAEITWLPEEKIYKAARMYAAGNPSAVQIGLALDMGNTEALPGCQAIICLMAICGNLDVPGGMLPPHFLLNTGFGWGHDLLDKETHARRLGVKEYPLTDKGFTICQTEITIEAMLTGKPYPIKGSWLQTTNFLSCTSANPKELLECFIDQECVVCVDLFMTPTAMALADYVLPAATFVERDGLRTCDGPQFGATINKVTEVGECKSDMTINREIGHRWNPEAWPWETDADAYTSILQSSYLGSIDFHELQQNTPMYKKVEYKNYEKGLARADGELGFNTPTGRVELYSTMLEACGLDPLPFYEEVDLSPISTPDLYEEYPLILGTGARDYMSFHSEHRQIPHLRAFKQWPTVEVNPETAEQYHVEDGDWVWLENHRGRAQRKVKITPTVQPWMIMTDHGWWYPEESGETPNNYGVWKVNINQLMENKCGKSGFGTNFKSLLCKMYKVEEGEQHGA